jgi:hypothetical protein
MILTEKTLRNALKKFFDNARIPSMNNIKEENEFIKKRIVPAFIEALKEIEDVRLCYKFDPDLVWRPEDRYKDDDDD